MSPARTREASRSLSTKDADEELARLFLASVLGVPVSVHDRRSGHSTYDLEIRYPGGRRGAAEVVSTRTQAQAAQAGAVRRAGYTEDTRLQYTWVARVPPDALISRARAVLPEFLAELERDGITDLSRNRFYGLEMRQRLRSLHISSCLALPATTRAPGFWVYPESTGAWVGDGEEIRLFCQELPPPGTGRRSGQALRVRRGRAPCCHRRHPRPARPPHGRRPAADPQPRPRPRQ